jgi:hypothetical protein
MSPRGQRRVFSNTWRHHRPPPESARHLLCVSSTDVLLICLTMLSVGGHCSTPHACAISMRSAANAQDQMNLEIDHVGNISIFTWEL